MRILRRAARLASLLLAALLLPAMATAASGREEQAGLSRRDEKAQRSLDRVVARSMERTGTPGVAVAWIRDGTIFYVQGYGVLKAGSDQPVTGDSIFEAASLGKPLFASAVVQLAVGGRINLDTPMARLLDDPFRQKLPTMMSSPPATPDPRLAAITPRMLLSHASGLPNWGRGAPLELKFDPGDGFGYSGEGYIHLEDLVEKVSGTAWTELVSRRIFEPMGMADSSYVWQERFAPRLAWGHNPDGTPEKRARMKVAMSATSLYTSAADYGRFLLSMMPPPSPEGSRKMAKAKSKSAAAAPGSREQLQMMRPANLMDGSVAWGLGWGLEPMGKDGSWFWHWGDNEHYKAFAMGSPSRREAVVILTNGYNGLGDCRAVVEEILGKGHPALDFPLLSY